MSLITPALANWEDIERLRKLEAEGHLPAGFADKAVGWVEAYLLRMAYLIATSEMPGHPPRTPYPSPDDSPFPVGDWDSMKEWKEDPTRVTDPDGFWARTYGRLQEFFGTR